MDISAKSLWTIRALLVMFMLVTAGSVQAKKVGNVTLEENISVNDIELSLNGAGFRKKLFIKLYVGSLYVQDSLTGGDAEAIVQADKPMLIQLDITSDLLTRDKLIKALNDGFNKATDGNTAPIQEQITIMENTLNQPIRPGDVYRIMYVPQTGTSILFGDETLVTIEGLPFKQAVFGIWLSKSPAQKSLKNAMLGS